MATIIILFIMHEIGIRTAAMNHLDYLRSKYGELIPYLELKKGFLFQDEKVHYLGPQGIFKPVQMNLPLTINTSYNSPYDDSMGDLLFYKYRGKTKKDIEHRENKSLKVCMENRVPLIYLKGVEVGKYVAVYPVFIIEKNDDLMEFTVAADDIRQLSYSGVEDLNREEIRRRYITREVKTRLHQAGFRARVLKAYRESCAFCRLKHAELLDAAHIIPDSKGGTSEVQNGMALCKIHHSAFDQNILGVDPDYKIHVREDILNEIDGPMLKHGIQSLHGEKLNSPRGDKKPNREYLEKRFLGFRSA